MDTKQELKLKYTKLMEYLEQTKTRKELQDFYSYSFELWGLSGIVKSTIFASIKGVSIFVLK